MVNELNKIMEYIRDTKNPVQEEFVSAATNHLMHFLTHKGLIYGLVGTGISVLLYKLCQNKWVSDVAKLMYNGTVNTIITIGRGISNTSSAIKYATIRTIDWTTGYFSRRARDRRAEDDRTALYALNLKNKLHALIEEQKENQGMILRNLDYLIYHNDWQGVIQLCNNEYENAETELKQCIANLYNFSHEAKLICQDTDYYGNMVDPRLIKFMTDNRFKSLDEVAKKYKIDIENIFWSKPDQNLYYSVMKEHFKISDNLLETRYVDNKQWFKPMYELISEDVAYKHNLTNPELYEISRNSKGVIERLKKELEDIQSKSKEEEEKKEEEEFVIDDTNNEENEEEEEHLTLEEAMEEYMNKGVKAIRFEQEMEPSNHFEYINNRVSQIHEIPSEIQGNLFNRVENHNNNIDQTQIVPKMSLDNIPNLNAFSGVILTALIGILGYMLKDNNNTTPATKRSNNYQTLPTTRSTAPETDDNVYDETDSQSESTVDINSDNKKQSKSLLQSISDYFWPKGTE